MEKQDSNYHKNKMNNIIKIILGVIIFLGLASGAFLLLAKKKTSTTEPNQKTAAVTPAPNQSETVNHLEVVQPPASAVGQPSSVVAAPSAQTAKNQAVNDQMKIDWQLCNRRAIQVSKELYWRFTISETIPPGGTYAKGAVLGQPAFPVHITIRAASPDNAAIKGRLVVGNNLVGLRGTCTGISSDGSVNFEAY